MATANKTYDEWVGERLEDCIMDDNERECNFLDGDIVDHPLVRISTMSKVISTLSYT